MLHLRDRERERQRDVEAERRRANRADLDADDTDEEREPWERRLSRYSRRAIERRKRRALEEAEDAAERAKEAARDHSTDHGKRQRAAHQRDGRRDGPGATPEADFHPRAAPARQATPEQPGIKREATPEAKVEVKVETKVEAEEPEVDPEDPIFRAMVAAARAAPHQAAAAAAAAAAQQHAAQQAARRREEETQAIKQEHARALRHETMPSLSSPAAGVSTSGRPAAAGLGGGRQRTALHNAFGDEEEEEGSKRKLKPIQYSEEELTVGTAPAVGTEDPAVTLKRMMDAIPTSRDGVFAYRVKWHAYDPVSMGSKFRGWLNKKVTELLHSSEPALVDYVMEMLGQRMPADKVAAEFTDILGQAEAEVFVLKLWRMLIYETEKSAMGL